MNTLNGEAAMNNGIQSMINNCQVALIKTTLNENGNSTAQGIIIQDNNQYAPKRNGQKVINPNAGVNLTVHITGDVPVINQFILGIRFQNLRVTSVYATSQLNSTFANVHYVLEADGFIFPKQEGER